MRITRVFGGIWRARYAFKKDQNEKNEFKFERFAYNAFARDT
jgi:hypothetical protein